MKHSDLRNTIARPIVALLSGPLVAGAVLASGCQGDQARNPLPTPLTAVRVSLASIATIEDPAVGVTFDELGREFVLTQSGSLYEVTGDEFSLVYEITPGTAPFGFTDITSVGEGRFALSSRSVGFLLDVRAGTIVQHFCYEPDWEPVQGEPVMIQTSYALTFAEGTIYAQPLTSPAEDPTDIQGSFFASYDLETGADLVWAETTSFDGVGGMGYVSDLGSGPRLLVAEGDVISLVDIFTSPGSAFAERLGTLGVDAAVQIEGLAVNALTDEFVFIDANSNELRTLPLGETVRLAREIRDENQPAGS